MPDSGRLDVTLDWTNASSLVGFYLVPANTCTLDEFNARSCNFLIRSETTVKPRKISTPNFNAGNYRWIIGNFSEAQESVSLQIVLSKGACAALGAPPSASDRANEAWPAARARPAPLRFAGPAPARGPASVRLPTPSVEAPRGLGYHPFSRFGGPVLRPRRPRGAARNSRKDRKG